MHTTITPKEQAQLLLEQGHEARRQADWKQAIECYKKAIALHPNQQAQVALEMAQDILAEWNRGMYDV